MVHIARRLWARFSAEFQSELHERAGFGAEDVITLFDEGEGEGEGEEEGQQGQGWEGKKDGGAVLDADEGRMDNSPRLHAESASHQGSEVQEVQVSGVQVGVHEEAAVLLGVLQGVGIVRRGRNRYRRAVKAHKMQLQVLCVCVCVCVCARARAYVRAVITS